MLTGERDYFTGLSSTASDGQRETEAEKIRGETG
jgi:hypothetical protein